LRYQHRDGAPSAPDSLPSEWRAIWDEVVNSAGADHWRAADGPALEAFVCALARLRAAQATIVEHGEVDAEGKRTAASRIAESAAKAVMQAAPKLRLCPSSRTDSRQASRTTLGSRGLDEHMALMDSLRTTPEPWSAKP